VVPDRCFLRKINDSESKSCKLLQGWGKTRRAILLIQLTWCGLNVVPPLQSQNLWCGSQ
jgi:hypothetical protein